MESERRGWEGRGGEGRGGNGERGESIYIPQAATVHVGGVVVVGGGGGGGDGKGGCVINTACSKAICTFPVD